APTDRWCRALRGRTGRSRPARCARRRVRRRFDRGARCSRAGRPYLRAVRTLCLGEALVDLVCERPVAGVADAGAFVPHPGGAAANVCVVAARHGGRVALAGGAGDDAWGRWLRERLRAEGVDLDWFALVDGAPTAVAFVTVDAAGEPGYLVYGAGMHAAVQAATER